MKFLIDAQLPRRCGSWFRDRGVDAIHTRDLPNGNRSSDQELIEIADREDFVVVTKDADFVNSHVLSGRPRKILLISLGNSSNQQLEQTLVPLIEDLMLEFRDSNFIELGWSGYVVRD